MKSRIRAIVKYLFHCLAPFLKPAWVLLKYLEYTLYGPLLGLLPRRISHLFLVIRWPWLFMLPSERTLVKENLTEFFGQTCSPSEISRIAARNAHLLSCVRSETAMYPMFRARDWDKALDMEGFPIIDRLHQAGKSVIILTCHSGPMYRVMLGLAPLARTYNTVYGVVTLRPEMTNRTVWPGRAGLMQYTRVMELMEKEEMLDVIYPGQNTVEEISEKLKNNGVILTAMDNPLLLGPEYGKTVPFMGRPCVFLDHMFKLAREHEAVCIPSVIFMDGHRCRVDVFPPWQIRSQDPMDEDDILGEMKYFFGIYEEHIRARPEQWWFWKDFRAFGIPGGQGAEDTLPHESEKGKG